MTEVHTCSYSCQRIECIRAQRDELRDRMESVLASAPRAPVGVEELAERAAQLYEAATSAGATHEQALHEAIERALAQQPAARGVVDGCHCATCTCNPWMTPAIRFDTSPAAQEGAIRDHLIALGWTPPGAQQPAPPSAPVEVVRKELIRAARSLRKAERAISRALAAQQQGGAK